MTEALVDQGCPPKGEERREQKEFNLRCHAALWGAVIPYPRTQSNLLSGCHEKTKSVLDLSRNFKFYGRISCRRC